MTNVPYDDWKKLAPVLRDDDGSLPDLLEIEFASEEGVGRTLDYILPTLGPAAYECIDHVNGEGLDCPLRSIANLPERLWSGDVDAFIVWLSGLFDDEEELEDWAAAYFWPSCLQIFVKPGVHWTHGRFVKFVRILTDLKDLAGGDVSGLKWDGYESVTEYLIAHLNGV